MKILFFGTYFYPYISGITTYPLKVFSHLAKKNEVNVLTFNHLKNIFVREKINNINVKRMPYLFRLSKGFISIQSIGYFFKEVKKSDVVFVNFPNAEGLALLVFAKILRKKIIGLFHCRVFLSGNIISKLLNLLLNVAVWMQMFLSDKIIIYTDDYFQSLTIEKIFARKIIQIYPPVELVIQDTFFYQEILRQKGDEIWVGFSGRTAKEKGIEYLVEAISQIQESFAKTIRLVFVGPIGDKVVGEGDYYFKILSLLKEKKIKHRFFGVLEGKKLWSFYKCIDLLALTSINQTEAFGMVQVEAMLAGKPVLASNLPGVRMPVLETKMGVLSEPRSIESIKNGLSEILTNYNNYSNPNLHQQVLKIFDANKVYSFYDKFLESIN